jgi:mediator of RNA polymerase II transcription subunit 16
MCWSATRTGSDWSYSMSSTFIATGPHHPEGKNALLAVSKSGTLRLLYQKDSAWAEVSTDIDEPAPFADATLTHAAFGAQGGT